MYSCDVISDIFHIKILTFQLIYKLKYIEIKMCWNIFGQYSQLKYNFCQLKWQYNWLKWMRYWQAFNYDKNYN